MNLIMGFCSNYTLNVVEPFLASLRDLKADIQLVLFTANMGPGFDAMARQMGVITQDAEPYLALGYHALNARFFMYRDYLARNAGRYQSVMLTDLRDVVFQSDPFAVERDADVWFAAEDGPIFADTTWNSRWIREIYGDDILQEIQHNPISCAGTTIGTYSAIEQYVVLMCAELTQRPIDRTINYDQGIHNFIVWKVQPEWGRIDLQDQIFSTVIMTNRDKIEVRPDGIWIEKKRPPVVHQWDRQPALLSHITTAPQYRVDFAPGSSSPDKAHTRLSNAEGSSVFPTMESATTIFRNETHILGELYNSFTQAMCATPHLLRHREHIEQNKLGFGDRAFHWQWKILVDLMPRRFSFLEIGVYKGQVLSLIGSLAILTGKLARIVGVTPLNTSGDKYSGYDPLDYARVIDDLESWCGIPVQRRAHIIDGLSTDDRVKRRARVDAPYNIVYIDGGHDFHVVANDIVTYGELVVPGGYLVLDDASTDLAMPEGIWRGHTDVGRAIHEVLLPDDRYAERLAIGHLRTWQKISGLD